MTDKIKEIIDMVADLELQWGFGSYDNNIRTCKSDLCPLGALATLSITHMGFPRAGSLPLTKLVQQLGGTPTDAWAIMEAADDRSYVPHLALYSSRPEIRAYLITSLGVQEVTACE